MVFYAGIYWKNEPNPADLRVIASYGRITPWLSYLSEANHVVLGVTMNVLDALDAASLRKDIPQFRAGDELKIHVRVIEGNKSRLQVFQGIVIRRQGDGIRETFTIRKISYGVGVERTFPVHTPVIEKIELVKKGDVRRAKLYYLRDLRGKASKIKEKRDGIEGYGDGITSTPVTEVVEAPVAQAVVETEAPVSEAVAETPAVEEVAVVETPEAADAEEAK